MPEYLVYFKNRGDGRLRSMPIGLPTINKGYFYFSPETETASQSQRIPLDNVWYIHAPGAQGEELIRNGGGSSYVGENVTPARALYNPAARHHALPTPRARSPTIGRARDIIGHYRGRTDETPGNEAEDFKCRNKPAVGRR